MPEFKSVFDTTDQQSHNFLSSTFFYMPDITKPVIGDAITVELNPFKIALLQLIVDGYMIELAKGSGKYYLTGDGRNFILRGGYAARLKREEDDRDLTNEQIQSIIDTNKNQRKYAAISLILAAISLMFIIVTVVIQFQDKSDEELSKIKTQLQQSSKALNDINSTLMDIPLSIHLLKTDTLQVTMLKIK